MVYYPDEITYSAKYHDAVFEYRHVALPKDLSQRLRARGTADLIPEREWRDMGIQQSRGWIHFMSHKPEPHILVFRRLKGTNPVTGSPPKSQAGK